MGRWLWVRMGVALSLSCAWVLGGPLAASFGASSGRGEGSLQTWWHWTSQYVTRAGITADLEAI